MRARARRHAAPPAQVIDLDTIEVSNLNRQFLFREENVGQQKSVAAAQRARLMNKNIKIDSRQVSPCNRKATTATTTTTLHASWPLQAATL